MVARKGSMTFLEAAKNVLEEMKVPMHFKKITELAIQKGYLASSGKTPEWTMGARISVDIKQNGANSEFARVDSGRYGLRRWKRGKSSPRTDKHEDEGPRYWLVSTEPANYESDLSNSRLDTVGVRRRMMRTLQKLKPGDRVVLYLKRKAEFGAALEVTGDAREDDSPRWPVGDKELSARISCKPLLILREKRVNARPIYSKLDVFTQYPEKYRTLALRNGITEISRSDFAMIQAAIESIL